MKKILISFTIIFSMMFTSVSFAEWTLVSTSVDGDELFVDFDRIRKNDGLVYFWMLTNFLEPDQYGTLSSQEYSKADCKLFRTQSLNATFYKLQNADGDGETDSTVSDWRYHKPNTSGEAVLNSVCK